MMPEPNEPKKNQPGQTPGRIRPALNGANHGVAGPLATYEEVDHLSTLMHELCTLLEGSMTSLGKAKQSLSGEAVLEMATAGEVDRQLSRAAQSLEKMSELVHAAMQGPSVSIGSAALSRARPVTLGEAVSHAVELLSPMALERGVELLVDVVPAVAAAPAGAMYTVVLNAVQNALESVSRRGGRGRVEVSVRHDRAPIGGGYGRDSRDWFLLEVSDDGVGPPAGIDAARVFDLGFTTKPRGTGVGLAVAKSVVQGMGGQIELLPRDVPGAIAQGGAVLRVRFPSQLSAANMKLGGAA